MTASNPKLLMRADLVHQQISMGEGEVWVVKDPLAREFLYFTRQEHEILALADGTRTLAEITAECSNRFAPQYLSAESIVRFFAAAQTKGLLVSADGNLRPAPPHSGKRRWYHNPLAIRLPGLQPDRWLDSVYPWVRGLLSPQAAFFAVLLIAAAMIMVVAHFASLAEHIAIASSRLGGQSLLLLIVVIALTKIVHELAHALVCKHFGGECREMGVMLLVGIPALYCDVSDAWMLERRWQRIFVSGAGMFAELVLAAIATLVWSMTVDGVLRDVCVIVMTVCSISTLLLNGNPLLRYDGYYILSDLLGIPNLAGQSSEVIRAGLRRFLWGIPSSPVGSAIGSFRRPVLLASYAVGSGAYRLFVYGLILLMLYRIAESHGIGPIAAFVILCAFGFVAFQWMRLIVSPPDRAVRRASLTPRRPLLVAAMVLVAMLVVCITPLPRSVVAPMSVQPAGAQTIFVPLAGTVSDSLENSDEAVAGRIIATLTNPSIQQELVMLQSQCDRLQSQLETLRGQRSADPKLAARIPAIEKSLDEANQRRGLRQRDAQRLTLRSPRDGRLYAPPIVTAVSGDPREQRHWTGTPLEHENRNAWLDGGTVLCVIGDKEAREAIVLLRQQDIELVRPDQSVTLLLAGWQSGSLTGTVREVAASPVDAIPEELSRTGLVAASATGPQSVPYYRVRVKLDDELVPLPVRLTGKARITVSPTSILDRLTRFLRDSFG